jgi:hypothetical protein
MDFPDSDHYQPVCHFDLVQIREPFSLIVGFPPSEYTQVKNWFSNQRQKESRANRENTTYQTPLASTLRRSLCDGRPLRLRPIALECFTAEEWTDDLFDEVVMIHNFRLLVKLRRDESKVADTIVDFCDESRSGSPPTRERVERQRQQ